MIKLSLVELEKCGVKSFTFDVETGILTLQFDSYKVATTLTYLKPSLECWEIAGEIHVEVPENQLLRA